MSNKIVFDEYGVSEDVLAELQSKWEAKVIQSHVAEFEAPPAPPQPAPPPHYPPHPMHMHPAAAHYPPPHGHYPPLAPPPPNGAPHIKSEPVDQRFGLNPSQAAYALPPLAGPQMNRPPTALVYPPVANAPRPPSTGPAPPAPTARYPGGPPNPVVPSPPSQATASTPPTRIPQVDGPSSSSSGSPSPPPSQSYVPPRATHPSLPQPTSAKKVEEDEEAINSDLDDSDSDVEREGDSTSSLDTDIVFCTYDKVARVKNKWKCILKDGMIHVNGKDYLFAKCTGEFEW
ncbi:hypothetical protein NLI96_g848 [Meripilus lineatus]|uniref:Uncharacterized protein n=1 Tax=Meripilus lineatus TaxID=2056292 RepID=A0AAD5VBX7_9APHY|nr:hypothetical protein NLI96_g848 [Physisporinus lineatus]